MCGRDWGCNVGREIGHISGRDSRRVLGRVQDNHATHENGPQPLRIVVHF
jgi:hypothetical protein